MEFKTLWDDKHYLENKYHRTDKPFNGYSRRNYHGYEYDPATGMNDEEIIMGLKELDAKTGDLPHSIVKAQMVAYVLDHTRIDVNEHDWFIGIYTWGRVIAPFTQGKWQHEIYTQKIPQTRALMNELDSAKASVIWADFDHVVPDWVSLMSLGFPGIRQRAQEYRLRMEETVGLTKKQKAYFDAIEITYAAIIRLIDRIYQYAQQKNHAKAKKIAECMMHLRDGAPTNIYEAMQLIYIFFIISDGIECYQVRSLGHGLDYTLYPFYIKDQQDGTYSRDDIREFLAYFLMQWSAIGNVMGQPMYLGGTDTDGETMYNPLSHDILDVYHALGIFDPKIQIKVNTNTPDVVLDKIFTMIREGQTSFVFCCEPGMIKAVMEYGATYDEARTMDIRGCYETGVRANEVSTSTGYVNALKPVEYAIHNGYDRMAGKQIGPKTGEITDFRTFEDFYAAVIKQWEYLVETTIQIADSYEPYLSEMNPSSMYSATIISSLEKARDGYQDAVKFNNSSVLNCGFASMVDSVMAVKKLVFDQKVTTLSELKTALEQNWVGYELLRAKAMHCPCKYGNDDAETDLYASALANWFAAKVNNRPNARGGVYKAIMHSAMMFSWQGAKTPATPDGRKAGDEISKNASPAIGMDKNGVTALIRSVTKLQPYHYHESFCLDIMLHPTTVKGDEGLIVMKALLDTYMKNGGMSMQFNIFNADDLRDAQKHPEKYKNLQVRVCGWNNLWNDLTAIEQEAYIRRAENLMLD